jgi:hypothetical protein
MLERLTLYGKHRGQKAQATWMRLDSGDWYVEIAFGAMSRRDVWKQTFPARSVRPCWTVTLDLIDQHWPAKRKPSRPRPESVFKPRLFSEASPP